MDITVTPVGSEPAPPVEQAPAEPVPAAPGSPLINLRAVRQAKLAKMYLDLPVPRWDEGDSPIHLVVRYRPLNNSKAITAVEKRLQQKADDWVALADADQLVQACVGVYVKQDGICFTLAAPGDDGTSQWVEFDPDTAAESEWVGFSGQRSPDLAAALGLDLSAEKSKAVAVAKAIYFTDGDMRLACAALAEWSSKTSPQAEEEALGE